MRALEPLEPPSFSLVKPASATFRTNNAKIGNIRTVDACTYLSMPGKIVILNQKLVGHIAAGPLPNPPRIINTNTAENTIVVITVNTGDVKYVNPLILASSINRI